MRKYEISRLIAEVCHFFSGLDFPTLKFHPAGIFAQKEKSRGGILVAHGYFVEKYVLAVEAYNQYARKTLSLLDQGLHKIVGY